MCRLLLGVLACAPLAVAAAGPLKLSADATAHLSYSDNIGLAGRGAERGDWLLRLSPGVRARWDARRVEAGLDYTLNSTSHLREDNRDDVWHQLRATANAELVREHFNVDSEYQIRQQMNSPFGGASVDPALGRDNYTEVRTLRVAPRATSRIGSRGHFQADIDQRRLWYREAPLRDSVTTTYRAALEAAARPGGFGARVSHSQQDVDFEQGRVARFEESLATVSFAPSAALTLTAGGGYERNEYTTFREHDLSGPFWLAGFDWRPARGTRLSYTVSERYFGTAHELELSHAARATLWSAGYRRALSSTRDTQFALTDLLPVYNPSCPAEQAGCEPAGFIPLYSTTLVDEYFLLERAHASVTYERARSRWTLAAHTARRTLEESGEVDRLNGLNAQWQWKFGPRSDFTATLGVAQAERVERDDRLFNARVAVTRRFRPRVQGGAELRHQQSDARAGGTDWRENAVGLFVRGEL